jgi:hypothetical protein
MPFFVDKKITAVLMTSQTRESAVWNWRIIFLFVHGPTVSGFGTRAFRPLIVMPAWARRTLR